MPRQRGPAENSRSTANRLRGVDADGRQRRLMIFLDGREALGIEFSATGGRTFVGGAAENSGWRACGRPGASDSARFAADVDVVDGN